MGLLGLALGGCSSMPSMPSFNSIFASSDRSAATVGAAPAMTALPSDFECPSIAVRQGAATLSQHANPADPSALNLRYQVGIGQTARECRLAPGNNVAMKVGIQGRVIIGPAGSGAGQVDVPIRLAVVREGADPKPIATKFQRVQVTIPPGSVDNVMFTHIENDLSFPMPPGGDIDSYIVYVGFDTLAAREPDRRKPAPRAAKPRPQ